MSYLTQVDLAVLMVLLIVYLSFSFGYVRGRKRGYVEGQIEQILILTEKSLESGYCSICGQRQDSLVPAPNIKISSDEQKS